ncbi:alpha/beta hydrolase [Paraburkholderia sp. J67]|uniref:alpha/beta hydrolase n=1 Tax=Paraburkholderia sp. J67 TaxID=2805435 RepID=UPI002ABD1D54|nr:alpha/beta hydrolase-fold protein [Paraburkholderia sp. J67]
MKRNRLFALLALAGCVLVAPAHAATVSTDTESTSAAQALLPDTDSFLLQSGPQGPRYRVWLYHPAAAQTSASSSRVSGEGADTCALEGAPPLLVLLDGNATFALAVSAARLQARLIGPVTIAAIAADNDALFDEPQRFRDFTTPNRDGWGVPRDAQGKPLATGGVDAFETLVNETLPRAIEARTHETPRTRMLFGHSLGGYFVLHDALTNPHAWSRYMAASPSLWWNAGELLARVRDAATTAHSAASRSGIPLAIRVGGDEARLAPESPPARVERVKHAAMIDNARAFTEVLNDAPALGFNADMQIYTGQNHVSYLPAAISEAVTLAAKHACAKPSQP